MILAQLLIQFAFRVTFGLAVAMALLPSRLVTSGFYRVHLWVLLGVNTLAVLVLRSQPAESRQDLWRGEAAGWLAVALAVGCYAASVLWLYERRRVGKTALWLIAAGGLAAAVCATEFRGTEVMARALPVADVVTSGLLLGATLAAMLLGHWYLNTPTMQLSPLRLLIAVMIGAVFARGAVSGTGLLFHARAAESLGTTFWIFLSFRWLTGILATLVFAVMAGKTLQVPNTQSATGILYAGVVVAFLGELMSQLLSVHTTFPV